MIWTEKRKGIHDAFTKRKQTKHRIWVGNLDGVFKHLLVKTGGRFYYTLDLNEQRHAFFDKYRSCANEILWDDWEFEFLEREVSNLLGEKCEGNWPDIHQWLHRNVAFYYDEFDIVATKQINICLDQ